MGTPEKEPATSTNDNSSGIDFEKRFKDTQGAYTKSQQELKAAKAKLEALEKLTTPKIDLDEKTKQELESLKYDDPEAWRTKMNQLEIEAHKKHKDTLDEAGRIAAHQAELERRSQVLEEFNKSHPTMIITDEVIKYDVPPRITSKLEKGEISFDTYLEEVAEYLKSPKIIGDGNKTMNQPNLGKVGGDNTPTDGAVKQDIVKDYKNIVY